MRLAIGILALAAVGAAALGAQQVGFTRTAIQRGDLSRPGWESVMAIAEFQPDGGTVGWHTHPGEEAAYILEGTMRFEIKGKPPVMLTPGQTFFAPDGVPHNATNVGTGKLRVLANYIVEKSKPLATAVAKP